MTTPRKSPRSKEQLAAELSDVQKAVASKPAMEAGAAVAIAKRKEEVAKAVSTLTPADLSNLLGNTRVYLQHALDGIQEVLTSKFETLDTVTQAVDFAKAELEEVHGKEVVAASLETLLADYVAKKDTVMLLHAHLVADLESQAKVAKEAHATALAKLAEEHAERLKELEASRDRELAEYTYATSKSRMEKEDAFQFDFARRKREADMELERRREEWAAREESLKAQEKYLCELQDKVNTIPAQLKAAEDKAAAIAGNTIKRDFEHRIALMEVQVNADKALLASEKKALQDKVAAQATEIVSLYERLAQAEKRVESIANNALNAASGKAALEAANNMAATLKDGGAQRK